MKKYTSLLIALLLFTGIIMPTSMAESYQKYSYTFFDTFDTVITLIAFAPSQAAFDEKAALVRKRYTYYHKLFDPYHAYDNINNLFTINQKASKEPLVVPDELFDLLDYCQKMQPKLHSTVNIAMGSVLELWHTARDIAENDPEKAALPDDAALQAAAQHTNIDDLVLDKEKKTVFLKDPLININLGAVAKGYATELVAQMLLESDMPSFIINAGGNVRTGLSPMDGRNDWVVALQDPDAMFNNSASSMVDQKLHVHDLSVVTSGDYQRYFTINGERYHHLISPATLYPARFMRSVTVVTRDSALADLLSTTLFLMSYEEGQEFLSGMDNVGAVWILNDLSVKTTDNLRDYLLPPPVASTQAP